MERVNHRAALVLVSVIAGTALAGLAVTLTQRAALTRRAAGHTPATLAPVADLGFTAVDDPPTHTVILFGGGADYDNTWLWNGTGWRLDRPPVSPPGRSGASAAYDPQTSEVLLFGGSLEHGAVVNDTWAWDGFRWREVSAGHDGPPPGEESVMAWDDATHTMVLVSTSITGGGETWIWSGSRWVEQMSGHVPEGAFVEAMGFDPVTRSLIAVGCCQTPPSARGTVDTTWRWDGTEWRQLFLAIDPPAVGSSLALDPSFGRLVLCSCDIAMAPEPEVWSWTGDAWILMSVAPVPIDPAVEVADSDRTQLLVLGSPLPGIGPIHVWSLTGSSWRRLDQIAADG